MNNELAPQVAVIDLGSITADADVFGAFFPKKSKILSMHIVNGAGIAQSDTDYGVVKLMNGSTQVASHSTKLTGGDSALTANVPAAGVVVEAASVVDAGSYLKANYDESGTYAMTSAKMIVTYFPL